LKYLAPLIFEPSTALTARKSPNGVHAHTRFFVTKFAVARDPLALTRAGLA